MDQPRTAPAIESSAERAPRGRRILWRTTQVVLGLLAGLALAELGFWWRDQGAFPHVNVYLPDAELGARLEPGAEQGFKLRDNPLTHIRINADGYRGAELPPPAEDEILVVGDSQVFGLGVEQDETFSAQLAKLSGRPVVNGGVPTYGPGEYTAVAREMLEKRSPSTVVYVVNMANDLFETKRPNRERHAIWDGWAVRIETAPADTVEFPGRRWLMSRSHAVYALRRWNHSADPTVDLGFASEGTWNDLVDWGAQAGELHADARAEADKARSERSDKLRALEADIDAAEGEVERLLVLSNPDAEYGEDNLRLQAARASPGDIVIDDLAEEGRSVVVTAGLLQAGVLYRHQLLRRAARGPQNQHTRDLLSTAANRDELLQQRLAVHSQTAAETRVPSVLEPQLRELEALCEQHGAELVVVALPIDVQVSADEWAKYGVDEPLDMEPTRVLLADLVASAEGMGVRALDVTAPLAEVAARQPAFLDGDIHLTPAGHRAVAEALAAKLSEPAPLPQPEPGLPEGRTRVPPPAAWRGILEATVRGSSALRCQTYMVAEWLRVSCLREGRRHVPSGIAVESGGHGEAMTLVTGEAATLVAPLLRGDELVASFRWSDRARTLVARWPEDAERPRMWFEDRGQEGAPYQEDEAATMLCDCYKELYSERDCAVDEYGYPNTSQCEPICVGAYGEISDACLAAYEVDCAKLEACARGELEAQPPCPAGEVNLATTGQCVALCSDERPCAEGTCTPYRGAQVCR
ncbi:alginate O-acetyltransferase AlgX-related protein [Haliangium ochraceum]|uniref:AlgX/AlgJ SGNH hydrolase-like domain-containing protein n=1 Tax=Haliangium ochraceum (strain DSM 14365 / JCM 11303 / SMP-2) TaxID=502025 RepID=D0LUV0_HALO1|nr:hypothetical protein [Haliangium ochraceum]ACY13990.1 hypothetical protein Hoch_1436 [Haliangium ochraceum DSM 14365]